MCIEVNGWDEYGVMGKRGIRDQLKLVIYGIKIGPPNSNKGIKISYLRDVQTESNKYTTNNVILDGMYYRMH